MYVANNRVGEEDSWYSIYDSGFTFSSSFPGNTCPGRFKNWNEIETWVASLRTDFLPGIDYRCTSTVDINKMKMLQLYCGSSSTTQQRDEAVQLHFALLADVTANGAVGSSSDKPNALVRNESSGAIALSAFWSYNDMYARYFNHVRPLFIFYFEHVI